MDEKQFRELMEYLKKIDKKFDLLINLAKLSAPEQEPTPEEKKILELCNLKNTVADMVLKTKKTRTNVKVVLSSLRSKGLIKSEKRDGKVVYSRF